MKMTKENNNSIKKTTILLWLVGLILILTLINVFNTFNMNTRLGVLERNSGLTEPLQVKEVQAQAQPTPTPTAPQQPTRTEVSADDNAVLGDANAPVTIIEFSDFECPFCARFFTQTLGQINEKYIKTGKVKLVFRDFPLGFHANAQKAAEAAECARDQDKFWEMHDKLFSEGVQGGVATFKKYSADLGLDTAAFDSCLDSGKDAAKIQKDLQDGQSAGVSGTPSFFINGIKVVGAQPFSAFEQIIEQELNK